MKKIRIGTRGSPLALWQAGWIKDRLEQSNPGMSVNLVRIKTTGDKIQDVALAKVGGKGLFVKEIEEKLLKREIDLAVHSMKDVPTELPSGLSISAMTEREDPRDALISAGGQKLVELSSRAVVGTSSLRRQAQLLNFNPGIQVKPLRGNLDTRIRKLKKEALDAIIVAVAGMKRMGWEDRITERLDTSLFLPGVGQGALGVETLIDGEVNALIAPLNHRKTFLCVAGERALLKRLEGGCQVPVAAYGEMKEDRFLLKGMVATVDGKSCLKAEQEGTLEESERIGMELAEQLLDMGGKEILEEIYRGSH